VPPRGVKAGTKRARQYEDIRESELRQGASEERAQEIAARTVNKERARHDEARTRSRSSVRDISSGRRGGERSGIEGRSRMDKEQLERAVERRTGRTGR